MGLAIGIGNGILFTSQRGVSSIIPGLIDDLCARATYCENKLCTTATLEEIEAIPYTAPVLPTGLLADYPGASAAYSLRNLIDTTTNVVRVRRSSDNTEQDFTAAEITDGTLTTFTGANDGFVTTWYDQSGDSNNAVQATATKQPKIVENGFVELINSKPSIKFVNKTLVHNMAFTNLNILHSVFAVGQYISPVNYSSWLLIGNNASSNGLNLLAQSGTTPTNWGTYQGVPKSANTNINDSLTHLCTMIRNSAVSVNGNFWLDSISDGTYSNTSGGETRTIGHNSNSNSFISEIVFYITDQSANRTGIETNINDEYTIY